MKILFVSSGYPTKEKPQYCIFLEQQAQALMRNGNHVDVLYVDNSSEKDFFSEWYVRNGIQIYKWEIKRNYLKFYLVFQESNEDVENFLAKNQYDVVSFHFGNIAPFSTICKTCKKIGTKSVMHFHGLNVWKDYYKSFKGRVYEYYYSIRKKIFLNEVDAIVGVSELVCEKIAERVLDNKIYKVYNGVNLELFSESDEIKDNHTFRIICVANLIKIKGQIYLLEAAARCLRKGYGLEMIFVGDGPDKEKLMKRAKDLAIEQQVTFLGTLKYEEVAKELKKSNLFILPSYFEAFGCVYAEAMSSGVVTCGCYNNGAEEIILHNTDGFLVREKNVDDIENVIIQVMENPDKAREIAKRGIKKASTFSWSNSAIFLEEVYKNVCSKDDK